MPLQITRKTLLKPSIALFALVLSFQSLSQAEHEQTMTTSSGTQPVQQSPTISPLPSLNEKPYTAEDLKGVDFSSYIKHLELKIRPHWHPQKNIKTMHIETQLTIGRDGTLLSYKITKPSGFEDADQAAIKALKKSTPFEPLPKKFTKDSILINFVFDIKTNQKSDKEQAALQKLNLDPNLFDIDPTLIKQHPNNSFHGDEK